MAKQSVSTPYTMKNFNNFPYSMKSDTKAFHTSLMAAIEMGLRTRSGPANSVYTNNDPSYIRDYKTVELKFPRQIGKSTIVKNVQEEVKNSNPGLKIFVLNDTADLKELISNLHKYKVVIVDVPESNFWSKVIKTVTDAYKADAVKLPNTKLPLFIVVS